MAAYTKVEKEVVKHKQILLHIIEAIGSAPRDEGSTPSCIVYCIHKAIRMYS